MNQKVVVLFFTTFFISYWYLLMEVVSMPKGYSYHLNPGIMLACGVPAGICLFWDGFKNLKLRRIIEDIPTSQIATAAVGSYVEISGHPVSTVEKPVLAPLSGLPCCFYKLDIQYLVEDSWKTCFTQFSYDKLYLTDKSGGVAEINMKGAKIDHQNFSGDTQFRLSKLAGESLLNIPHQLNKILARSDMRKFKERLSTLFNNCEAIRLIEWRYATTDSLYVLGYAASPGNIMKKPGFKNWLGAMKRIKSDPGLQARFDLNKDGVTDREEMETGARWLAEQQEAKEGKTKGDQVQPRLRMQKKHPIPFIIHDYPDDRSFLKKIKLWGIVEIVSGILALNFVLIYVAKAVNFIFP